MLVTVILSVLTLLSVVLLLWQFIAALRFPLHRRLADVSFTPGITILKPLKGATEHTAECLRSWLVQEYAGKAQLIFGVADESDSACEVVRQLLREFPSADAELIVAPESLGPNAKVSTLVQLARRAKHDLICISDADVLAPKDFLANAVVPLCDSSVGLVNCFYELANPVTLAMRWEAIAVNADFWSQVLQSNTIKPQDFALGAAMLTRRETLAKIGGLESLLDYLADDYELGHRIAATGARIELSPVVVECRDKPMNFRDVWRHQLRWARTIRACQPTPYFFSVLNNVTLWALLLILFGIVRDVSVLGFSDSGFLLRSLPHNPPIALPYKVTFVVGVAATSLRMTIGSLLATWLTQKSRLNWCWLVPLKDLLQVGIWLAAFLGNTVQWGGKKFGIKRGGRLVPVARLRLTSLKSKI